MSKAKVTARAAKAARSDEPFGWIDIESEMRTAHPLAVMARAVAILQRVAFGETGMQDGFRVIDGLIEAIMALAKHEEYDAIGWLLYGLEETVEGDRREEWPLSGSRTDVPEAFRAVEEV